jgi:hypothetical protein
MKQDLNFSDIDKIDDYERYLVDELKELESSLWKNL